MAQRFLISVLAGISSLGCTRSSPDKPEISPSEPSRICVEGLKEECLGTREVEKLLRSPQLEVIEAVPTPRGLQGAAQLTVRSGATILRAKWRADGQAPSLLGVFSDARRSAIAYAAQYLFLDEDEIVVPPTVGYCLPLETVRRFIDRESIANAKEVPCVFGFLSFWLVDADPVRESAYAKRGAWGQTELYSPERFLEDRKFATKLSRVNVLTYVIDHDDAHGGQFLATESPFHLWSIDHSMSLTSIKNPMVLFKEDWSKLIVPAIPRRLAERLSRIDRADVEKLENIEGYEKHGDRLVSRPHRGGRDEVSSWGATERERGIIWSRIQQLQQALESEELGVF